MKLQRIGAVALTVSLLGLGGVANADDSIVVKSPSDSHTKCHALGNGGYIVISPSSASYVTEGHGTRDEDDVYGEFSFRQNDSSEVEKVKGKGKVADLEEWVDQGCTGEAPVDEDPDGDPTDPDAGAGDPEDPEEPGDGDGDGGDTTDPDSGDGDDTTDPDSGDGDEPPTKPGDGDN